jgi:hypothetical protein
MTKQSDIVVQPAFESAGVRVALDEMCAVGGVTGAM